MIYLERFRFPTYDDEFNLLTDTEYDSPSVYPFGVLCERGLHSLDFTEITILYGGNGSGKSTALNIISNALDLPRGSAYNRGYEEMLNYYLGLCSYRAGEIEDGMRLRDKATLISSDDIFKYMQDTRNRNEFVKKNTHKAMSEWENLRRDKIRSVNFETGDGVEHLNRIREARRVTRSQYVANKIGIVKDTYSNGETGFMRFIDSIVPDRLYILDEPENSLSCELQIELAKYIELSARYYGCQFIIATHSPFLMAISGAKLYNLDGNPATISKFWELPNMQLYYNLFRKYVREFDAQCQSVNEEQDDSVDWDEVIGNPIPMDENSKSIDDYLKEGYMTLEDMTQALEQKFAKRQKDEVMNKMKHNNSFDYE